MNLKEHFSRFFAANPDRLHFAAHSHHPWPDVSYHAHLQAWQDAAELADDKWDKVFGEVVPDTQTAIASRLGLADPKTITFAPNTHSFLVRLFSCLDPPVRILSTDAEFHSFNRQSRRWEEAGLAIVDRVTSEPFETFPDRFSREARAGVHDLIYLSQVFYDSGYVVPELDRIVSSISEDRAFVVVDGYHGFMALPSNLGAIQDRIFYLAGGYKYAMAGEGVCFLHSPPGYAPRPIDTGWYAGFGQLESGVSDLIPYADDGSRFAGATYDPSGVYRMRAVLEWLKAEEVTVASIREHVEGLQARFLDQVHPPGQLLPPRELERGNFLTFRDEQAPQLYRLLHDEGIITDYRGDRIRLGFGVYQDDSDVDRLVERMNRL